MMIASSTTEGLTGTMCGPFGEARATRPPTPERSSRSHSSRVRSIASFMHSMVRVRPAPVQGRWSRTWGRSAVLGEPAGEDGGDMDNTVIPAGTIVVGLDGSPSADRALDWAIDHARRERRQLTLVHGLEPMHERAEALAMLDRARLHCLEVAPDLAVHAALWMADPRVALLDLGHSAATVVVGSHGRGPVSSVLLGSVGLSVTRHAPCPVVVVRPQHPGAVRNGVLVAADERSRPVVEFAYRQASLRDLPLTIVRTTDD